MPKTTSAPRAKHWTTTDVLELADRQGFILSGCGIEARLITQLVDGGQLIEAGSTGKFKRYVPKEGKR